jgi:drug/metabolite transporter (DMT)-like permease
VKPEALLTGIAFLWGTTFIVTKHAVHAMAPLQFLTARFAIAALVLVVITRKKFRAFHSREARGLPAIAGACSRRALVDGVVLGLLNSTGLVMQVFGQVYTTASKSSFITSLNTPLTPLVALALYRTRPSRPQLVAVALATAGLALLTWPGGGARWNAGDLLTIGCAAMYALTIVEIARRTPRHEAMMLTTVQVVTAALMFATLLGAAQVALARLPLASLPELLRLEARPFALDAPLAAEIVYMALVCTVVTFAGQTWAMARMSATHAAVIFALEPVFATALAVGILGTAEWPGARGATGAGMVLCAVLVSEIRSR